jgi:hypothetical protein
MQIVGILIFLFVWMVIFWIGSITLEATGLDRKKARFQALSALTGCGFTTTEAESIVNHAKRRKIVSWMIFLGSVGIVAFFLLLILYVRSGLETPTVVHIVTTLSLILLFSLLTRLGVLRRVSDGIVGLLRKGGQSSILFDDKETIYQIGDFIVTRLKVTSKMPIAGLTIGKSGLDDRQIKVLTVEGIDRLLFRPKQDDLIMSGDTLLCYGKAVDILELR